MILAIMDMCKDHCVAQAVSHQLPTMMARV